MLHLNLAGFGNQNVLDHHSRLRATDESGTRTCLLSLCRLLTIKQYLTTWSDLLIRFLHVCSSFVSYGNTHVSSRARELVRRLDQSSLDVDLTSLSCRERGDKEDRGR